MDIFTFEYLIYELFVNFILEYMWPQGTEYIILDTVGAF